MSQKLSDFAPQKTERLHIRPLCAADVPALVAVTNVPAITEIVHFLPTPFTPADAQELIGSHAGGRDCFFGVWESDLLIGVVGTHLRGTDEIEIGYWFAPSAQGRGFAGEAVGAVIGTLAARFPARTVVAECRPANTASWRLLERLGLVPTGEDGHRQGRQKFVLA